MRRGIGHLRAGGSGIWTPVSIGALVWLDRSDLTTSWQDTARTTGAAVGSTVASRQNKGSLSFFMQQATGASRPFLRQDASGYYDELDGLDDGFLSSATLNLAAYSQLTICFGMRKDSDAAQGIALEFGPNAGANNGSFVIRAPGSAAANYGIGTRGTVALALRTATTFTAPNAAVITARLDNSAGTIPTQIDVRINGVAPTLANTAGPTTAGAYGNQTLYEGRQNNSASPITGRIYQTVVCAGTLTGSDLSRLETFVGAKMGITI